MQRFPLSQRTRARRRRKPRRGRRWAAWALPIGLVTVLGMSPAGAAPPTSEAAVAGASGPQTEARRPEAARPGAFCLPGGCGAPAASPWNAAAFGLAVVALTWHSRRRPSASA